MGAVDGMRVSARTRQWLLLCALAFAVIGMHHVPLTPHVAAPHSMAAESHVTEMAMTPVAMDPSSDSGTGMGHDLSHLCVAILYAAGLLLLAWLMTVIAHRFPGHPPGVRAPRPRWRPPATTGRSLLTFVCVSRT